jgi:hypothetical protein
MRLPTLLPACATRIPRVRALCVAFVLAGAVLGAAPSQAASKPVPPYKHPKGYYTIVLPEGFKMKEVNGDGVMFENKGGMGWFRLDVVPVKCTMDIAAQVPVTTFKKLFPNAAPDAPPQDFDVNGAPARWMVYRGTMTAGGQAVPMVGMGGAITFPAMAVTLVTAVGTEEYGKYGEAIAASFKTIRAGDAAPPPPATSATSPGGPASFPDPAVTLDLPAGWRVDGGPDGAMFAKLAGPDGATLMFFKTQKLQVGKNGVATVPETSLLKAAPQFQLQSPGAYPMDTMGGAKISAARYQGPFVSEGRELDGRGYVAFGKSGKQNLFCLGIAVGETAATGLDQMEAITRSLR